jgi:holo-[acyl-carrier protein] synthase
MSDLSIGVDIVSIDRVDKILKSDISGRFLYRVFTDGEITYCESRARPSQHFAGRFAAKEAVKKAIMSRGVKHQTIFKDIEIKSKNSGAPLIKLPKKYSSNYSCECSISHDGDSAVAFVIMQKK